MERKEVLLMIFTLVSQFLMIFHIAGQVLIALAAYQDARSLNNRNAALWGVLIGLLGFIPGIIYLCMRKKQTNSLIPRRVCATCRAPVGSGLYYCVYCGEPVQQINPYTLADFCLPQEYAKRHARAKVLLIVGCVLLGLAIVGTVANDVLYFTGAYDGLEQSLFGSLGGIGDGYEYFG